MSDLDEFMSKVDRIDADLVALLRDRFTLSREIGRLKLREGKPRFDSARIAEQKENFVSLCRSASLDGDMALGLINGIIDQVLREREQLYKDQADRDGSDMAG